MSPLTITLVVGGALVVAYLAATILLSGTKLWPARKSRSEMLTTLRAAAEGRLTWFEWDNFVSIVVRDPELDRVRETCWNEFFRNYTPTEEDDEHGMFADPAIQARLRQLIHSLESAPPAARTD